MKKTNATNIVLLFCKNNYEESFSKNSDLINSLGLRNCRLLKSEKEVQAIYPPHDDLLLKKGSIDSLIDDDIILKNRINYLIKDSSFKSGYDSLMQGNAFQKQFNEIIKKGNSKIDGGVMKNLNLNEFYESMETINDLKKNNKKNKKLSHVAKNKNHDNLNGSEMLQKMVHRALQQEKPKKGFMKQLYDLDKKFEAEMLRAMKNNTSDTGFHECRFKTGYEKFLAFLDKAKIFIPPTVNMMILMLMLPIVSYIGPIFGLAAFTFSVMTIYYVYKFCKMKKVHRDYKIMNKSKNFKVKALKQKLHRKKNI
ncbi:Plasmodium exported protein, unknown function [Plasmodium malariae]|uniref:Pv-fam-d protein n=1 Tax=Plasmodium malariae TaxID=5858 RepID=A0A1D3JK03_PLAMA|nr:Plasmodium exported protein, unknown function [Plasmodium malariae]SBT86846.1 Plasmodium exported protein, unknown function [Plasmodium malariae]